MSLASIPAERWYGGPKLRSLPSNLNERRSRPNSRRVSWEETLKSWARMWIRSTIPSVTGSKSGISRAQMTSASSR